MQICIFFGVVMFWVVLVLCIVAIAYVIMLYNQLVAKRNSVDGAWAQIDTQLARRHDLIPNLVNAVKGYMAHESQALTQVMQARTGAISAHKNHDIAQMASAEQNLSQSLGGLYAVAENYPQLRADSAVKDLMDELSHSENRIGFARQHYNDSVQFYHDALQMFPSNILANFFRFEKRQFFTKTHDYKTPAVDFS